MNSTINIPVERATVLSQWGVFDKKTNKVIRTNLTRRRARNYSRRSRHYVVVRRPIFVGIWE